MGTYFIESVGFSGSTTLASILGQLPFSNVVHGTKNFNNPCLLGVDDLTAETFIGQMCLSAKKHDLVASVHSLFAPEELKILCQENVISFMGLVRHPEKQINSCYGWAYKKIIQGDPHIPPQLIQIQQLLIEGNIRITLSNLLYAWACRHVVSYNIRLLNTGCKLLKMEKLLSDENYFSSSFNLPAELKVAHFHETKVEKNQHKNFLTEINASEPERDYFYNQLTVQISNYSLSPNALSAELGYSD